MAEPKAFGVLGWAPSKMVPYAKIVIGANFGDEGKGLITDFLSSSHGTEGLVIRHNGGPQAGHTVVTPDGKRHVFKHFGSGSLGGAKTFLSRYYACNPILFLREKEQLEKLGAYPSVYVDNTSAITTPYDMMLNQIAESTRGNGRHGSCGLGFGETIERNQSPAYALVFEDLKSPSSLRHKLLAIQSEWVPYRLIALNIPMVSDEWRNRIASRDIFEHYLDVIENFLGCVKTADKEMIEKAAVIIFEGAQGLLLDQESDFFPHVTRSHTGIRNAAALAADFGVSKLEVTYVTRAYATRHGVGPFPHELESKPYPKIIDETNIHNEYQGSVRFGWLDLDLLSKSIAADLAKAPPSTEISHGVAVTCLDQIDGQHSYVLGGTLKKAPIGEFLEDIRQICRASFIIASHGHSRRSVKAYNVPAELPEMSLS